MDRTAADISFYLILNLILLTAITWSTLPAKNKHGIIKAVHTLEQ